MNSSDQAEDVVGHERRDLRPASVIGWGIGIFALMLFVLAGYMLYKAVRAY